MESVNNEYYSGIYTFDILPYSPQLFVDGGPSICYGADTGADTAYLLSGQGHEQWLTSRTIGQAQTQRFNIDNWDVAAVLNEVAVHNDALYFSARYNTATVGQYGESITRWAAGSTSLEETIDFGLLSATKRPIIDLEAHNNGLVGLRPGTVYYPNGYTSTQKQWIAPKLELISADGNYCTLNFSNHWLVDEYSYWSDIDVINIDADTIDIIVVDQRIRRTDSSQYEPVLFTSNLAHGGGRIMRVRVNLP